MLCDSVFAAQYRRLKFSSDNNVGPVSSCWLGNYEKILNCQTIIFPARVLSCLVAKIISPHGYIYVHIRCAELLMHSYTLSGPQITHDPLLAGKFFLLKVNSSPQTNCTLAASASYLLIVVQCGLHHKIYAVFMVKKPLNYTNKTHAL